MRDGSIHVPSPAIRGSVDGLMRAVFDASPLPMWIYDAVSWRVLAVNACALDYFGICLEQFPAALSAMLAPLPAPDAGPGPAGGPLQYHRRPDGTLLAMRLQTNSLEVEGSRARLVVATDATRETRALADYGRCRGYLDAMAEWLWECDDEFRVSYLSPEFAAATGLLPQSLIGRRLEEGAVTAGTTDQWELHRPAIEARAGFRDFILRTAGADGNYVWLRIGGTPVFDAHGDFLGYRGGGSNVTAEFEKNLALRRREQRYARFFAVASVWFWENDESYRLTYVSPNSEAALGMSLDDYRGRRLSDMPGVTIDAEVGKRILAAQTARRPYEEFIYSRKRPDGTTVWINTSGAPMFDDDGKYRGYCGIARDVTGQIEAEKALHQRDRSFRQLYETASDWLWETSVGGILTYISPNFQELYGLPIAELLGRRLIDHSSARIDPAMGQKAMAAIMARAPLRGILYTHEFAGGRVIRVKTNAVPVFDAEGVFRGYLGVSKDVTAELEAERVLRESEAQFRQVLEAAADYYWEQDARYRYSYLSPGYEKLFGIPPEESFGKRLTDLSGVSVDPEMGRMALRAQKTKQPYRDFIYCRTIPDGGKRWFKSSAAPIFNRNGEFDGYRGVGAEITQQVEAEATARLALQRLKEAVGHVSQPIAVFDTEDRIVGFNQAFTDLHLAPNTNTPVCLGASFRDLAEWQLRCGFYGAATDDAAVDLETLLARHLSEAEQTYRLGDGRWMLVVYRRLPGGSRVGLWTDVTALKRTEAERRALERQVHHSQRLESLGTLAGGVAHEINNALVPVIALTKMMAGKAATGGREQRNLSRVLAGAERTRDLVKKILAFSRKEAEEHRRESVDVAAVLAETLLLMRATLPASIRVEHESGPVPRVSGDPSQLQQVIVNLMTNAAQAIGVLQGVITVTLRPDADGTRLRLSVADTGAGMDEATLARIFEPFFTTKEVGEGTGLGLSVVHGIVKDHGGSIEVASTPGEGTRFAILLPAPAGGTL